MIRRMAVLALVLFLADSSPACRAGAQTEPERVRAFSTQQLKEGCRFPTALVRFPLDDVARNVRLYYIDCGSAGTRRVVGVGGRGMLIVEDIATFNRFLEWAEVRIDDEATALKVVRAFLDLSRIRAANEYGIVTSPDRIPFASADADERRREISERVRLRAPVVVRNSGKFVLEFYEWSRFAGALWRVKATVNQSGIEDLNQTLVMQWIDEADLVQ